MNLRSVYVLYRGVFLGFRIRVTLRNQWHPECADMAFNLIKLSTEYRHGKAQIHFSLIGFSLVISVYPMQNVA